MVRVLFLLFLALSFCLTATAQEAEVDDTMLIWCSYIKQNSADVSLQFALEKIIPSEHRLLSEWTSARNVARGFDFYRMTKRNDIFFNSEMAKKFGSVKNALQACDKATVGKYSPVLQ